MHAPLRQGTSGLAVGARRFREYAPEVLDDRVRAVLARLEEEDRRERERGRRARSCARVRSRRRRGGSSSRSSRRRRTARCSRSAARAATRRSGSPRACATSAGASSRSSTTRASARRGAGTSPRQGSRTGPSSSRATRSRTLPAIDDVFDVVFIDAEKDDYERLFQLARGKVEPGALFVADNVLSHEDTLGAYSRARQADPTLESVTVPLDRGLELSRRPRAECRL